MTNEEIVAEIQRGINVTANMERLYSENIYLIGRIVDKIPHEKRDHDDCMQEAYLGLYDAAMNYDPDKGVLFMSYADFRIRNQVVQYLRNDGVSGKRIPSSVIDTMHKADKLVKEYENVYGKKPQESYILNKLGISKDTYDRYQRYTKESHLMSIDSAIAHDGDGDELTVGDIVSDPSNGIDDFLEDAAREQASCDIWQCVDELPEREKQVVKQRYKEGASYKEITNRTGLTVNAISNARRKAKRMLSTNERMKLAAKVYGIYGSAYRGSAARFNTTWTSSTENAAMRLLDLQYRHHG